MPLINCEISFDLTLRTLCVTSSATGTTFAITNKKVSIQVVTLSSQDSANLSAWVIFSPLIQPSKFYLKPRTTTNI